MPFYVNEYSGPRRRRPRHFPTHLFHLALVVAALFGVFTMLRASDVSGALQEAARLLNP
jgi:hypothetical protein